jgi:hypothetical protein
MNSKDRVFYWLARMRFAWQQMRKAAYVAYWRDPIYARVAELIARRARCIADKSTYPESGYYCKCKRMEIARLDLCIEFLALLLRDK